MGNVGVYLSDQEAEYLKNKPRGYLRDLLKRDMAEDGVEKIDYKAEKKSVATSKTDSGSDFARNVYACKECGQVLCAGKCINKYCKRFNK